MKHLTKDAKNFVEEIVEQLEKEKSGVKQFPKVKSLLQKVSADASKDAVAKVITAVSLTEEEKDQLKKLLSKRMNHPVTLECVVRTEIIGGMRIEISDSIIDVSYDEALQNIGRMLVKGSHI